MPAIPQFVKATVGLPHQSHRNKQPPISFMRDGGWVLFFTLMFCSGAHAQQSLTWQQVRERFETNNPNLLADKLNIDESKAEEITAHLRPNPNFTLSTDGTQIAPYKGVWQ